MVPDASPLPLLAVALPCLTAVAIVLARRAPRVVEALLGLGAVLTFGVIGALFLAVRDGRTPTTELFELVPGLSLSLRADGMGIIFAVLASILWVLASSYAVGYMRGDDASNRTRFYAFYALCLATAFAVAFAGDLFTFFIAYELLTVSTYPLVTHNGNEAAIAAGRKYLAFLLGGGVLVLFGLVILTALVGDVTFVAGGFVGDALGPALTSVTFLLFAVGFGTKAGLMPLHRWLPAAMVAPTPVSALLHAVAVVKGGVFAFGRLIGFVFGPDVLAGLTVTTLLAVVAGTTLVLASVVALRQDHLKRRLAYSTIAHLAYIVLGFALLAPTSFEGSLLHIVNHGVLKITLFFCAGALHVHLHLDHVSELDGVGRQMPYTMGAFALASLGLAGLPPMGGFVSKWYLVLGAYEAEQYLAAAVMAFGGLFTAAYLFPIVYRAFFRGPTADPVPVAPGSAPAVEVLRDPVPDPGPVREPSGRRDASRLMVVPLSITAGLGLLLGLGDLSGLYGIADDVGASVASTDDAGEVTP
jgi:multicomponent Na+:H+ antiporter subunit D